MKIFTRILFVLYVLFLIFCAYAVWYDPPWATHPGRNVGAGMVGFIAAFAAGFPWSLAMFPIGMACETMRHPPFCKMILSNEGAVALFAIGAAINFLMLGSLAFLSSTFPRRKRTPPPP